MRDLNSSVDDSTNIKKKKKNSSYIYISILKSLQFNRARFTLFNDCKKIIQIDILSITVNGFREYLFLIPLSISERVVLPARILDRGKEAGNERLAGSWANESEGKRSKLEGEEKGREERGLDGFGRFCGKGGGWQCRRHDAEDSLIGL